MFVHADVGVGVIVYDVCNCKEYNLTNMSQGNGVFHMLNMGALRILNKKQE